MSLVDDVLTKGTKMLRRTSPTAVLLSKLKRSESSGSLNISTKACNICRTEIDTSLYPDLSLVPKTCQTHCSNICTSCLKSCLATAIEEKPIDHIGCPTCDLSWDRPFLEQWATLAALETYDSRKLMPNVETEADFRKCQSRTCASGQVHIGGEAQPMMTCAACGFVSCYTHSVPWHAGMSCAEYDDMLREESEKQKRARIAKEEAEYQTTFGEDAKPCPGCKVSISKASECNTIRCPKCNFRFCWLCKIHMNPTESGSGRSASKHKCPFYGDAVTVPKPRRHHHHGLSALSPFSFSSPSPPSPSPSPSPFASLAALASSSINAVVHPNSSKQVTWREDVQGDMIVSVTSSPLTPLTPLNHMKLDWEFCTPCGTIAACCKHKKGKGQTPSPLTPLTPPNHMKLDWENFCCLCGTITPGCEHKKGKGQAVELETKDEEAIHWRWWKVRA